jgi:uncharacterized protein (DUF2141 family)
VIKIQNAATRCDFQAIPPEPYALALIHDENSNGSLDSNLLDIPIEGCGWPSKGCQVVGRHVFVP